MIEIIKELDIEVSKPNVFQAVVAKQYDMNTRFIKATFVDSGNKIFIDPEATVSVVINALRPDGESKGFEGEVNEDGTVTVPLHSWMLELVGTVICDISVIDTEADDNKKLTTTSFTLLVEQAAFGGTDITTDPQYDVLVTLLEASETAQEALEKSNEANAKYEACVEATEAATAATEELTEIKQELAEGGYIHSIREKNHGKILSFWVGTKEEYETQPTPPENCYVIISNDPTLDELKAVAEMVVNHGLGCSKSITVAELDTTTAPGFYYIHDSNEELQFEGYTPNSSRKVHYWYLTVSAFGKGPGLSDAPQCTQILEPIWAGDSYRLKRIIRKETAGSARGVQPWEWENPPMDTNVEYRTTERNAGKPVYTRIETFNTKTINGSPAAIVLNAGTTSKCKIIRYHAYTNSFALPYKIKDSSAYKTIDVYPDADSNDSLAMIEYKQGDNTNTTLYVQLWYTK